ncbi:hypothetical protein WR25_12206 isoform F [Diploscapter pachys]|nr:hypothetical protein WR25_12206 isoform C [Diploscapter pachys]PAV90641.1 hypothetical protein WR25_12206 isoform E [Diploscapter pachys]PAV90642.1 hypothetical protein WR25_12206 isoform F [Diploscapter pachys]
MNLEVRRKLGLALWNYDGKELLQVDGFCDSKNPALEICYAISTSGTTGLRKSVAVPRSCIWKNIEDFRDRFQITSSDVILFSTSVQFDPSVIELFLAFECGSTILLTPDEFRSKPHLLVEAIRNFRPTVVQLTPAVLFLMDERSLSWILGDGSPLRILLIGGEKFPWHLINKFRTRGNSTRIFDVYGVTEVSCWASVFEVPFGCENIFIGTPIFGTELIVSDDSERVESELLLGGPRKCYIDGEFLSGPTPTGDLVANYADGLKFDGRRQDRMKINGIRFNPTQLCSLLCLEASIKSAHLVIIDNTFLVLFVQSKEEINPMTISGIFPKLAQPVKVFYLDSMPINRNGKIDREALRELAIQEDGDLISILEKQGISLGETDLSMSFVDYGFTSLSAAEIAFQLKNPEAMRDVLNPHLSISKFLEKYSNSGKNRETARENSKVNFDFASVQFVDKRQPLALWAYDTGKCIDGNVAIGRTSNGLEVVVVASHSGRIACIEISKGLVQWEKTITARIEASPIITKNNFVVVGAYDGIIYVISLDEGAISWKFNTNPESSREAMPKCACVWKCQISCGSPAQPQIFKCLLLCTTINGTVESMNKNSGVLQWKLNFDSPIFSPLCVFRDGFFYGTTVGGEIFKILETGQKVDSIKISSPIFAPVFEESDSKRLISLTQDGSMFIFNGDLEIQMAIKFKDHSFVRAPFKLPNDHQSLYLQSTTGYLLKISEPISSSVLAFRFRLSSSLVFSRPTELCHCETEAGTQRNNHLLLVGGRDDWLRCYRFDGKDSHFDVKIEDLEDDGVRIERPTPKCPDTRRTSAPAILWSASSFVSDQVNFRVFV